MDHMIDGGDRECFGPGNDYRAASRIFDLLSGGGGTWAPRYIYESALQ